jgi:hypothetical protein
MRRIAVKQAQPLEKESHMNKINAYWKAIVALAGSLLMIWNEYAPGFADILPASWSHTITIVVGILTAVATFGVPNSTTDPAVAAEQSVRLKPVEAA